MRIISLELENIKSYRQARVDFTPGLNAVCGLNGSGKTTVLEAIGFALFDYLPYNQQAFVREGEKSGIIRIRLLARDERQYEVVRRIGAGGTYYVADLDSGLKLTERAENVQDWIGTQALGIESETELKAIFKDAVGVPQGMMTSDFKATSAQRKAVFDPLLRVEEYRDAFESLRDTVTYVKDLSVVKREDIARLETEIERAPRQEEEKSLLEQRLSTCRSSVQDLLTRQARVSEQKHSFDETAQTLQVVRSELETRGADVARHREMVAHHESRVEGARLSEQAVKKSLPGYESVIRARQRMVELEKQRKERDSLQGHLMESQALQRELRARIDGLEKQIKEASEATTSAANLDEMIGRQQELEEKHKEAAAVLRYARGLEEQVVKLRAEIKEMESLDQQRLTRLSQARQSRQQAAELGAVRDGLREVSDRLADVKHLKTQGESIQSQGSELRKQQLVLINQVEEGKGLHQRLNQLAPPATELPHLTKRLQDLREERIRIVATRDYQSLAKGDLEGLRCPLLEVKCPVVSSDIGALSRFDQRVNNFSERLAEVEAEILDVTPHWAAAESAQKETQELQVEVAKLAPIQGQLGDVERRIEDLNRELARILEALKEEPDLLHRQQELQQHVERLDEDAARAAQVGVLEEQQERDRLTLRSKQEELRQLEDPDRQVSVLQEQEQALVEQLKQLGDPRSEQKHFMVLADRRTSLEENRDRERRALHETEERMAGLRQNLEVFHGLDEEIDEQRQIQLEKCEDYDRYLSNREEASQLRERTGSLAAAQHALQESELAESESRSRLEQLIGAYKPQQHEDLRQQYEQIGKDLASRQTDLEHWSKTLEVIQEDLARLALIRDRLLVVRSELDELQGIGQAVDFIRDTIKSAGPAITETLLTNISRMANDIYAEILDDHSTELRWERDYEVVLQHGPEVRKFSQLSGGEQMSAALAVRLALLKEMSEVDFAFFDEPTQNMDSDRRTNLADQIRAVRGFEQLVVISHDDTFEHHTDNLIRLRKVHEETEVEVA